MADAQRGTRRLHFEVQATAPGTRARAGVLHTRRGAIPTPVFMPVGTHATVKGVPVEALHEAGSRILLVNAYHLLLRPGVEVFERLGGIHRFMNWTGPVLSDSGGFQVFSLSSDRRVTEEGAVFQSYVDGARVLLSPERSIATQLSIGSDIVMAMDVCVPATADRPAAEAAMHRTHRWAERSLMARGEADAALFGIVQGACFDDLRRQSAETLAALPFEGFAIGGLAVGESRAERERCTAVVTDLLPSKRPRYLMGVGLPIDLLEAVDRGVDMFDCTIPSLLAKQGVAFTSRGRLDVWRGAHRLDERPIDETCGCPTCRGYSRAYLHHLARTGEVLGWGLLTRHNLHVYHGLMAAMREHVRAGTFASFREEQRELLAGTDRPRRRAPGRRARRRRSEESLERFEIRHSARGYATIVDRRSGEIMHAGLDPVLEAERLYVEQPQIERRLREPTREPLVVWDVGLGAAYNAMSVVRCCEGRSGPGGRPVHLVSFEKDLGSLRLALRHAPLFPHLLAPAPNHLLRDGTWHSSAAPLSWTLLEGDFFARMEEAPAPHCILYDPFSTKVDPEMWTLEGFTRVLAACGGGDAELFTYSASTAVRAALLAAGFYVGPGRATGSRPETTVAMTPAAASRASERGRRLLDRRWLDRWRRSHAGLPRDVGPSQADSVRRRIVSHPQFARRAEAS